MASKLLELLKELLNEDNLDIKEVMEVLGYEIVKQNTEEAYEMQQTGTLCFSERNKPMVVGEAVMIGYDEVITIRKEHR